MENIKNENSMNLAVYINGNPDLSVMPTEALDLLCSALLSILEEETAL